MLKRYQRTIGELFRLFDLLIVAGAWLLAYWVRFYSSPFPVTKGYPEFRSYAALLPLTVVVWGAVFSWARVYESRRLSGRFDEMVLLLKAHWLALVSFIAITYAFEDQHYSRLVVAYFALIAAWGLAAARFVLRSVLRYARARGYNLRHVLAVGDGPLVEALVERIDRYPELGVRVAGILTPSSSAARILAGRQVLGHYEEIAEVVSKHRLDEVIVALGANDTDAVFRMLEQLQDESVALRLVPDVHRYITLGCEVEEFDGIPVVRLNDSPLIGPSAFAKRLTDLCVAGIGLFALTPLLLFVAALVKLTSRGPVLYGQERMGLDGRTFVMYKFRSMRTDAELASGAVWAKKDDSRRTPIGTFLRKTSLDELPQLWHVLRGEMSLVGPRPERPIFVEQFRQQIPHYMLRHRVRAGITGWAQVNGWRGDTSLTSRIQCDLFYIKNWSYFLDWKILFMTLWKGFIHKNAY